MNFDCLMFLFLAESEPTLYIEGCFHCLIVWRETVLRDDEDVIGPVSDLLALNPSAPTVLKDTQCFVPPVDHNRFCWCRVCSVWLIYERLAFRYGSVSCAYGTWF